MDMSMVPVIGISTSISALGGFMAFYYVDKDLVDNVKAADNFTVHSSVYSPVQSVTI